MDERIPLIEANVVQFVAERHRAATRMQARFRLLLQRHTARHLRMIKEHRAAVRLQCFGRAIFARRDVAYARRFAMLGRELRCLRAVIGLQSCARGVKEKALYARAKAVFASIMPQITE